MGWGIWKKIKQGISKIGQVGKKIINKVVENAPKIINTASNILNSGKADGILNKLNINKDKLNNGLNMMGKITNLGNNVGNSSFGAAGETGPNPVINFAGKSWAPQFK